MKYILQIDGGGIRGIIPAIVLSRIEEITESPSAKLFDLITGSSTGTIIGGACASDIPAKLVADLYINDGKRLFSPRNRLNPVNIFKSKYDRNRFIEIIKSVTGNRPMNKLSTDFMATAYNMCTERTQFIKSWDNHHGSFDITDVISWSALSAPYYFGKINVPNFRYEDNDMVGAVFQDGGQSLYNNTLNYIMTEILANGWEKEGVTIVSLGTGSGHGVHHPYSKMSKKGMLDQIKAFFFQAYNEAILDPVFAMSYVAKNRTASKPISFLRIDYPFYCSLDDTSKIESLKKTGEMLASKIDDELIKKVFA